MNLSICHLYPNLLNIYGDRGNIITLVNRCLWRGIKVKVTNISVGDNLDAHQFDLFFGGGGQDRQQLIVAQDLQKKKKVLHLEAKKGIPMLTICGTYQLFGHYFKLNTGEKIPGISIFDLYTVAGFIRKIGNVMVKIQPLISQLPNYPIANKSARSDLLVGFENHWGNTFLQDKTSALGKIIKGGGNNSQDKTEGAVRYNVLGTYLHGPVLPKNPHLADWLIQKALEVKYKRKVRLESLDDSLEWQAHQNAQRR